MKTIEEVARAVREKRIRDSLTFPDVAAALECSASTAIRLEQGKNVHADTLLRAVRWVTGTVDESAYSMGFESGRRSALDEVVDVVRGLAA